MKSTVKATEKKVEEKINLNDVYKEIAYGYELALENYNNAVDFYKEAKERGDSRWMLEKIHGDIKFYDAHLNTMESMARKLGHAELVNEFRNLRRKAFTK